MPEDSPQAPVTPAGVIQKATESASARFEAAQKIPLAPEKQPEAAQEPETPQMPEAAPKTDDNQVPSYFWEGDYSGQKLGLSKEETDHLVRMALDAIQNAKQRQPDAPPQGSPQKSDETAIPPEAKKILDAYMKPFMDEFNSMKEKLTAAEKKELASQVTTECNELIEKNETLKRLKSNSKIGSRLPGMIMALAYANPDMSLETASRLVAETWEEAKTQENKDYVHSKVAQAAHRVEGSGGAVPAPGGKKLGAQDIFTGKVAQSALARLQRAMGSR